MGKAIVILVLLLIGLGVFAMLDLGIIKVDNNETQEPVIMDIEPIIQKPNVEIIEPDESIPEDLEPVITEPILELEIPVEITKPVKPIIENIIPEPEVKSIPEPTIAEPNSIIIPEMEIPNQTSEDIIYYNIEPTNDMTSLIALQKAIYLWEALNPELDFIEVDENPHVLIRWTDYLSDTHAGLASCEFYPGSKPAFGSLNEYCALDIALGAYDCNNEFIPYTVDGVTNIIMHEIGHALGLAHNMNENHLMYGDDAIGHFDAHGYTIPSQMAQSYVGEKDLDDKIEMLNSEIETLNVKTAQLEAEYNRLYKLYQPYEGKTLAAGEYAKATELYEKLSIATDKFNNAVNESNKVVNEVNKLVDQYSCYPNMTLE